MTDKEFWKKLYQGKWQDGIRRAEKVGKLIQSFGYDVGQYGFLADSDAYSKESPDEKGIPDLEISLDGKRMCLLEITGTVKMVGSDIWIRPDKFEYGEKHKNCWLAHVEESTDKIRFLKLEYKERFDTIHPKIRGVMETYKSVPVNHDALVSTEKFREYLDNIKSLRKIWL